MKRFQKFPYFRSQNHLRNVASLPCQLCGVHGQTQASHSNQSIHGHGRSIKASDEFTAAICVREHAQIDQGRRMTREERVFRWMLAYHRTVRELVARELWPLKVEIPDTREGK